MQSFCTVKNKIKKKKWSVKTRFRVAVFSILLLIMMLCFYYFKVVCPVVINLSQEKIRSLSTQIISRSIGDVLISQNISYDQLVEITYSS